MTKPLDIDHNEIGHHKKLYRRFFDYQPVDHLPVFIWLQGEIVTDRDLASDIAASLSAKGIRFILA